MRIIERLYTRLVLFVFLLVAFAFVQQGSLMADDKTPVMSEKSKKSTASVTKTDDDDESVDFDMEAALDANDMGDIADPFAPFNKVVFAINKVLDAVLIRPVSIVYKKVFPHFVQRSVESFLFYLTEPVTLVNGLLQRDPQASYNALRRFGFNTVFGFFGLADSASHFGWERDKRDFGQTLASFGAGEGFYTVIPIVGPSNVRDTIGLVVDFFLDPLYYYAVSTDRQNLLYVRSGAKLIDTRSRLIDITNDLDKSPDPYDSYRVTFTDNRRYEVNKVTHEDDKRRAHKSGAITEQLETSIEEKSGDKGQND